MKRKNTVFIFLICLLLSACKKETKTNGIAQVNDSLQIKNNSEKAIATIKDFYFSVYGNDENNADQKKKYLSERVIKRIDSLTSDSENLILDYDPFINGQDYDGKTIKKTLQIEPLNDNEYRVSFFQFGQKNEKRTTIDFLLKEISDGNFLIDGLLSNNYLNFGSPSQITKNISQKIIDSISGKNYSVVEKKECDLNNDSFKDLIVVFANNKEINPQDPDTKIAPIVVLINQNNTSYKVFSNENIYPNSFADAFKNLVIKNSFFTVELTNEVPDNYTSDKYITFKYDAAKNNIFLSKYGENINWSDSKTTAKICTSKDFGEITFENYNSDNIRNFCK
ncbi:DUF3828 domain-containing protein [Chryseobacterium sp. Leaf180]|uniref:DUF3828 domain-containing protein n=1 Tax=Chryseobacterium sp. Leaf180 TaxID=1736289 RepID=UPI0009EC4E3E|nr:DUF3828 domain-containing protein [Chryseobacterium sp. Leaf180]